MPAPDRTQPDRTQRLRLADEQATARLGAALAGVLRPGDTVLLAGALGAGKSALARAVIAELLADPEAGIPSPSYTLVNVYDTVLGPVWHADLYRLSGEAGEIEELGLDETAGTVLMLVEWPDRLGAARPARHVEIRLTTLADSAGRDAEFTLAGPGWDAVAALLEHWR